MINNSYSWFQQRVPGSVPVTLIYQNNQRPLDMLSRFSRSKSGSTGTLTVPGVQATDEAIYYCGSYDDSSAGQSHDDIELYARETLRVRGVGFISSFLSARQG